MKLTFFELMQAPLSNLYAIRELQLILDGLSISGNDSIVEIGPGNGLGSLILSKYAKKVIGIDISEPLIKHLNKSQKLENVEFHVRDATKYPPEEFFEKFDVCICADVMEHVENPEKFLRFITKILRRGGGFVDDFSNQ